MQKITYGRKLALNIPWKIHPHSDTWCWQSPDLNALKYSNFHGSSPSNLTVLAVFCIEKFIKNILRCKKRVETYTPKTAAIISQRDMLTKYWLKESEDYATFVVFENNVLNSQ